MSNSVTTKHQAILTHWGRDKITAISQTIFSYAFSLKENVWISIKISLKFVPNVRINKIPALVQIMAWRRPGSKPLSGPMMVNLLIYMRHWESMSWYNQNKTTQTMPCGSFKAYAGTCSQFIFLMEKSVCAIHSYDCASGWFRNY